MTGRRLRRSMLFVPGNNPGMIMAAPHFGADAIILDLEDSIPLAEKDAARELTAQALSRVRFGPVEKVVRINAMSTPFARDDIETVLASGVDTLLVPKADPDSLSLVADMIAHLTPQSETSLIGIIETAAGLVEVNACARAPRVSGLFLGAEDLTLDAGMERTKEGSEILYARSAVVFASAAARISSIDSPYTDVTDDEGLRHDLLVTRRLGFTGKACIHPLQVQIVHEALAPEARAVEWAKRVIAADQEAQAKGLGAVSLDGQMVDAPIVARARAVLAKASIGGGHNAG